MDFAVLAAPDSWYSRDLARAAAGRHALTTLDFGEIRAEIAAGQARVRCGSRDLAEFDAVVVRTMPPGSLEQVVFRMDCLARYEQLGGVVLNPPRAIEAAVDKFLTSAKLAAEGLPTPRTICCQTADDAMAAFAALGGDVVLKPLFGSEGRGITRLTDEALALRAFKMLAQLGAVLYVQEFVPHEGFDMRLLVIGERTLGIRRRNPLDWRTNISRGAVAEPFEPGSELVAMARRAASAVGAPIAGVDILPAKSGALTVLEVNAVPGWKGLARAHEIDVADMVLEFVAGQAVARKGERGRSP